MVAYLGSSRATRGRNGANVSDRHLGWAALTIAGQGGPDAPIVLKVHLRASADGATWDTSDLLQIEVPLEAGVRSQKTVPLRVAARFFRVIVENPHAKAACRGLSVLATLEGG